MSLVSISFRKAGPRQRIELEEVTRRHCDAGPLAVMACLIFGFQKNFMARNAARALALRSRSCRKRCLEY